MVLLGVNTYAQQAVTGTVILLAVSLDIWQKRRGRRVWSQVGAGWRPGRRGNSSSLASAGQTCLLTKTLPVPAARDGVAGTRGA